VAGGVAGLATSALVLRLMAFLLPHPALERGGLPLDTVLVGVGLGLLAALVAGLLPALWITRDLAPVARGMGREGTRLRSLLVSAQLALTMAMLLCAGLLAHSMWRLSRFRPGFDMENVLVATLGPRAGGAPLPQQEAVLSSLRSLPGVSNAALGTSPANVGDMVNEYRIPGAAQAPGGLQASCNWVTPDYLATCDIHLREGRTFQPGERTAVIINESLARRHWPGRSALGQGLNSQVQPGVTYQVVGVVEDVLRLMPDEPAHPLLIFPNLARELGWGTVLLRTTAPPSTLVPRLRAALADVAPGLELRRAAPLQEDMAEQTKDAQARALLLAAYALTALLLAAVGIHGLVAFAVAQRTREFGVRMALGAQTSQVLRMVLGQGLRIGLASLGLGALGGMALGRLLSHQLFGIGPSDPVSLAFSGALLLAVTLLATLVPALRAARIQPVMALRSE